MRWIDLYYREEISFPVCQCSMLRFSHVRLRVVSEEVILDYQPIVFCPFFPPLSTILGIYSILRSFLRNWYKRPLYWRGTKWKHSASCSVLVSFFLSPFLHVSFFILPLRCFSSLLSSTKNGTNFYCSDFVVKRRRNHGHARQEMDALCTLHSVIRTTVVKWGPPTKWVERTGRMVEPRNVHRIFLFLGGFGGGI